MNSQHDPPWAQGPNADPMGLDMHSLGDDEFGDILNSDFLSAGFADLNNLEGGGQSAHPPFGDSLVQSNGDDGFLPSSQTFRNASTTATFPPGAHAFGQPPLELYGDPRQGRYIHTNLATAPQPHDGFASNMRGALPTPNSSEIYGKNFEFYHQQQQARQQQQQLHLQRPSVDLNTYTPFESPGLDGSHSAVSYVPDYNPSGAFALSPISSPAINPQWTAGQIPRSAPRTAEGSVMGSPRETRIDNADDGDANDTEARPRKTRRKAAAPSAKPTADGARARKSATGNASRKDSTSVHSSTRGKAGQGSAKSQWASNRGGVKDSKSATPSAGSVSSSISPRPLDEEIMAPPPKPAFTASTPTQPLFQSSDVAAELASPAIAATPASLMRAKGPSHLANGRANVADGAPQALPGSPSSTLESGLEFLSLPEPAAPDTASSSKSILRVDSSKSITQRPEPKSKSNTLSERSAPGSAVQSPNGPVGMNKPEGKEIRSKKRNSNGSNLVSPALRPKVSPGIKPLLPEGGAIDSQTQALLLASKSNYENILSGNHLPGVSYPADLGANLTSKRTSHKLAEQGRRNRINDALKEMQMLLPPRFTSKPDEAESRETSSNNQGSNKTSAAAQNGNSKAATVEDAIEYIKALQQENETLKQAKADLQAKDG